MVGRDLIGELMKTFLAYMTVEGERGTARGLRPVRLDGVLGADAPTGGSVYEQTHKAKVIRNKRRLRGRGAGVCVRRGWGDLSGVDGD